MNTTAQALVFAIASVAAAAAIGVGLGNGPAQSATPIVKLERVMIVGKRAGTQAPVVAQLPRVVVEGRRAVIANDVRVAGLRLTGKAL